MVIALACFAEGEKATKLDPDYFCTFVVSIQVAYRNIMGNKLRGYCCDEPPGPDNLTKAKSIEPIVAQSPVLFVLSLLDVSICLRNSPCPRN